MITLGKRGRVLLATTCLVTGGGLIATQASATLPGTTFNAADANLIVNGAETDWATPAPNLEIGTDTGTGSGDNSFGNGTQERDLNVTVGLGSIPNSKADLGKFAVASETVANGDVFMYLAWTRNNTSGSTNFDFEINKAPQPDLTTAGAKTLVRTPGDLLINYSLQGGAQVPTLNYRTWLANGTWSTTTDLAAPIAEASINTNVAVAPGPLGGLDIQASQFGEASINMTAAGIILNQNDPNAPCAGFGSAYVKSRASQSFTSEIKDFIAPIPLHLNTCGTIVIKKVTDPSPDPTATSFSFSLTGPNTNKAFSLVNGGSDTTVDRKAGTYVATETVPAGWDLDALNTSCDDGSPVNAISLQAGETVTCTFTNKARAQLHVFKTAERAGNFDFTSGTLTPAAFTLAANGAGQDFADLIPGGYDVAETVPEGWDLQSSSCDNGNNPSAITLGVGDDVTCTFHNVVERGALVIHKVAKHADSETGEIDHAGVTFTVTNGNGTNVVVVTDDTGTACVSDLPVSFLDGNYTITETLPAGYHNANLVQSYAVVEDTTCADAVVAEFENIPLTNITVSVDSQIDGGTASNIDCVLSETDTAANGDGSLTLSDLEPGVYVCTITVDP